MDNRSSKFFIAGTVLRFFLALILLPASSHLFSQERLFTNQQHFGVEDGLPQSYITGIIQDADGFIWLSTFDGFCRYDGRAFRTFRYSPKDSTGLSTNTLLALGKLSDNTVTIYYSPTQADEFNLRTFKTTPNTIRNQLAGIPGIRWQSYRFGYDSPNWFFTVNNNKGIGWLNGRTGKMHYASTANGLLHNDTISAITQSAEGRIYVVSEKGVEISDTAQKKFEWHGFNTSLKQRWTALENDPFGEKFSIASAPGNRIAMLENDKLTLLDVNNKSARTITLPPRKADAIMGHNNIRVDSRGRFYFEYYGRIYRISEKGELKLLWEHSGPPTRISALFIDRSDVLWLSLNAQGLLKIDLKALHFESYKYRSNFIGEMTMWIGGNKSMLPYEWDYPDASYYFRQAIDSKNNFYTCNSWYQPSGIFQFTAQGFRRFPHLPDNKVFYAVVSRANGEIWAFDHTEAVWYKWNDFNAVPEKQQPDPASYADVELADAREIGGYIWMTTYMHGLFQFDGKKIVAKYAGPVGNYTVPKTLTEICEDPVNKNRFWIGSRGGGLLLWDVHKGLQRIYTTEDGLPNNTVYCILPDKKGRIWCSTNRGLFRLDPATGHIIAFEKTDGLQSNEFNRAHKFVLPDGRLVFGGLDGYTVLNPDDFDTDNKTDQVPVLLTGFQINNEPQDINIANSIVKGSLSTLSSIVLPHDKNYLRFEFAALLYNQPQRTRYRYQLAGADKGWIENSYSNVASYSALPPGHYTFRINATADNGLWSGAVKEIKIVINPPFWATWWAWLTYALIAVVLVRWYLVFREKRLKIQQNLAFEKREALRLREVDELKDRFFSNITHEFRTPLTLIITPLEKLAQDNSLSPVAISNVKTAQRNSKQLLRLINEFLDFSKLNDGQLKLKTAAGELAVFTADCVASFDIAAKEKNIALTFTATEVAGYYLFDEEKWEKIVTNLLSNALKFTPLNGQVAVTLAVDEDEMIQLTVTDNGPGIPAELQQKIFTRFYQVDDSAIRHYGGTGIGLSLVKELTELMQGSIQLRSRPGALTSFIVSVPMKKVEHGENTAAAATIVNQQQQSPVADADAPLLLIVEDNDELRSFLVESMGKYYRVLEAADGLKAWELILQEMPDMVISDVMMPGQDGFDLCKRSKTDNRTAHIGFILLTSKAAHEARLQGLGTGADDYITKPFNLYELELRVANLYQLQQKQRAWLQLQLKHNAPADPLPEITDPFLLQLYKEMDAKLEDPELGVDYLCKAMAMSRSTLNRKLKSLLNISTNDLIRQYRLQKAASLISDGLDITSAAYRVGFSSPSYFSQCFKEKYGMTPSDWISNQHLTQN